MLQTDIKTPIKLSARGYLETYDFSSESVRNQTIPLLLPQQAGIYSIRGGFAVYNVAYTSVKCSPVVDRSQPVWKSRKHVHVKNVFHKLAHVNVWVLTCKWKHTVIYESSELFWMFYKYDHAKSVEIQLWLTSAASPSSSESLRFLLLRTLWIIFLWCSQM